MYQLGFGGPLASAATGGLADGMGATLLPLDGNRVGSLFSVAHPIAFTASFNRACNIDGKTRLSRFKRASGLPHSSIASPWCSHGIGAEDSRPVAPRCAACSCLLPGPVPLARPCQGRRHRASAWFGLRSAHTGRMRVQCLVPESSLELPICRACYTLWSTRSPQHAIAISGNNHIRLLRWSLHFASGCCSEQRFEVQWHAL